ncbi:hypothetical protein NHJ13051_006063 [Beauveria bassiana]
MSVPRAQSPNQKSLSASISFVSPAAQRRRRVEHYCLKPPPTQSISAPPKLCARAKALRRLSWDPARGRTAGLVKVGVVEHGGGGGGGGGGSGGFGLPAE